MASYNKLTVEDLDPAGKRVLVRVDFNVPLDDSKKIDAACRERLDAQVGEGALQLEIPSPG